MANWTLHTGNTRPVPDDTEVQVKYRDDEVIQGRARSFDWASIDNPYAVRNYRIVLPEAPVSGIESILEERGKRYGKFVDHAEITLNLKFAISNHATKHEKELSPDQTEALDMICHKIGRIVNGDPDYADSWVDIAGYAQLVADRLNGVER